MLRKSLENKDNHKTDFKTIRALLDEVRAFQNKLNKELQVVLVKNTQGALDSLAVKLETLVDQRLGNSYIKYPSFPQINLERYESDELRKFFFWAQEVDRLKILRKLIKKGAVAQAKLRANPKSQPIEKKSEEFNTLTLLPSLAPFSIISQKKAEEQAAKTLEVRQKDAEAKMVEELSEFNSQLKAEYLKPKPKKIIHLPLKKHRLKINFQTLFKKERENNKPKIKFDELSKAVLDCKANKDKTRFQNQIDALLEQYETLQKSNKNNRCEIDIKCLVTFLGKLKDLYSDLLTADQNDILARIAVPTTRPRSNSLPSQPPH